MTVPRLINRPTADRDPPLASSDDLVFLLQSPMLALTALLSAPENWFSRSATIRKTTDFFRPQSTKPGTQELAGYLGMSVGELVQAIDASRTGRIEHLVHCYASLLRPGWQPQMQLHGKEHLEAARTNGKGGILWATHFCYSSLMTKQCLAQNGYGHSHVSRPEHGISKSRLGISVLNKIRVIPEDRHLNARIVHHRTSPDDTRTRILETLSANGFVSITVGAWEGRRLVAAPILGGEFVVAAGAPSLAFKTGARLLPVFSVRGKDGTYHTHIGSPLAEGSRADRDEFMKQAGAELMQQTEPFVREHPDQWRGWKDWLKHNYG